MADLITTESTSYDSLISGLNRDEMKTFPVTAAAGTGTLKRGALVTFADGKVSAVTAKTDTIFGIIAEDVDITADADAVVYVNGDFNKNAVVLGDSLNVDDFILAARNVGIFLRDE